MTAFNVVRFRVKPGREEEFLNAHRKFEVDWSGLKKVNMIKSGDRSYCIIGEWADMTDLVAARPKMIAGRACLIGRAQHKLSFSFEHPLSLQRGFPRHEVM